MTRDGQAPPRWRGWTTVALGCLLAIALLAIAARHLGITDGRQRAHNLLVIDTALGATLEPVAGDKTMVVTSIATGGPADRAGIGVGDVVEQIDGRPAARIDEVAPLLADSPAVLVVNRHGTRARLRLPIRPAATSG